MVYCRESIKNLWGYSSKLLLSSVITVVFNNIYVFFIGKIHPVEDVGYYAQANKYSEIPNNSIVSAMQAVIFPVMASIGANDSEALKRMMRKTIRVASFVIFPVMLGLIVTAEPLVLTLIGTKWLPFVPYLQILCVGYIFIGMTTFYNNILYVKGLSSTFLYFNLLYRALVLISIVITMYQGITAMIIAWDIVAILYALFMMAYIGKKIQYSFIEQLKDIAPYFIVAISMSVGVFCFTFIIKNSVVLLLAQLTTGATFYLGATYLLGSKVFREAIEMVKRNKPI
jgi:O-antigen/teichoic acid export membrane protein